MEKKLITISSTPDRTVIKTFIPLAEAIKTRDFPLADGAEEARRAMTSGKAMGSDDVPLDSSHSHWPGRLQKSRATYTEK